VVHNADRVKPLALQVTESWVSVIFMGTHVYKTEKVQNYFSIPDESITLYMFKLE
jgi:hypothetical protein